MLHHFWKQAEHWQAGVGALIGFSGLWVASQLSLRRERLVQERDVHSIAAALYAELLVLRREAQDLANMLGGMYVHRMEVFQSSKIEDYMVRDIERVPASIFTALLSQIGKLPPRTVLALVRFHRSYQKGLHHLDNIGDREGRKFTYSIGYVLQPLVTGLESLEKELPAFAHLCGQSFEVEQLMLNRAREALELEEDMFPDEG